MFYNPKIVIKRIKELQGDESENSMAKRLGISQVTLNYCLSGKRKPSLDLVYRICDIYGSSIDWLLGLTDQRSPFIEAPRENKVSKTPEIREKFPSFGSPVCRSVRQSEMVLNPKEISDILCNLSNEITQLKTQISALQSASIATCG